MGNSLVMIMMFGWIPVVLGLFAFLPPRRAVIVAFLVAWMFLPMAVFKVPGITAYSKMTATCFGVLLGAIIFDPGTLLSFRPRWFDWPMLAWCICPFASSMANGLGPYDGASWVSYQLIAWGIPYYIGRVYFRQTEHLRELAVGIFIGGLVYVPLCLFEIRMSPQLHTWVYGYHQHDFSQTMRWGGFRPTVFMQHGLMVGMWMTTASLLGVWLWQTKGLRSLYGIPMAWLVVILLATTVLCKSTGALILLAVGLAVLNLGRWLGTALPFVALLLIPFAYYVARVPKLLASETVLAVAAPFDAERVGSLEYRLRAEDLLMARAMQQPVFGWGGWGRARVKTTSGVDVGTDGMWIITLGNLGLVGLVGLTVTLLLPPALFWRRWRVAYWSRPHVAPLASLAVLLSLHMIDNIANGMFNPIYVVIAGGLGSAIGSHPATRRAREGSMAAAHLHMQRPSPA